MSVCFYFILGTSEKLHHYVIPAEAGIQKLLKRNMKDLILLRLILFPKITSDAFFFIEFERPKRIGDRKIGTSKGVNEGVNEGVNFAVEYIKKNPGKRAPYIAKALNKPLKTLERWLKKAKTDGKIRYEGSAKTGGYYSENKK